MSPFKGAAAAAPLLWLGAAVHAAPVKLAPLVEARIRYEHDDQADLAKDADALVLRLRAGVQAGAGRWSALAQGEGTVAAIDRYYDGLHGLADRPIVYDPQSIGLYRAQLQYKAPALTATLGRQRIVLDDERFVGIGNWRINGQTFNAARAEWAPLPALKLDLAYVRAIRTFWGSDGVGARPTAIGGNSVLANLVLKTGLGTVTGFAYLIDEDNAAVQGFRLENQTYGARLTGGRALGHGWRVAYKATVARQSDWHRNPSRYAASYLQLDATLSPGPASVSAGYERLGASSGAALTSVQFPFGTNFLYQGWANKFLTTPADGLRDLYGGIGYGWQKVGPADTLTLQAVAHRFTSDLVHRRDGDELDLLATAKLRRTTLTARFADYRADAFATDTRKLWLQAEWVY